MALSIKNREVEALASEVARLTGETKTEAIRRALAERKQRLALQGSQGDRRQRVLELLEKKIWPQVLPQYRGRGMTKAERGEILGYGPEGV